MQEYTGTENLEIMSEAVNYNRFLLSVVQRNATAQATILDFGAGIGTFAKAMSDQDHKVLCVEPDPVQLRRLHAMGLSASASLSALADDAIDLLYTLNVLEHIEDDQGSLAEMFRKIKPGGLLLIYVPAFQVLFSSLDRQVGHFRRYTRAGLEARVTQAGFRIETSEYVDFIGFFAAMVFKAVDNGTGVIDAKALVFYDRVVFPLSRLGDVLFKRLLGKNVLLLARRPA